MLTDPIAIQIAGQRNAAMDAVAVLTTQLLDAREVLSAMDAKVAGLEARLAESTAADVQGKTAEQYVAESSEG